MAPRWLRGIVATLAPGQLKSLKVVKITASGQYIVPLDVYAPVVVIYGAGSGAAGGGGGYSGGTGSGGGGSCGNSGPAVKRIISVVPGETLTFVLGDGGAGGVAGAKGAPGTAGAMGADGGFSTITGSVSGLILKVPGGFGGLPASTAGTRGGGAGLVAGAGPVGVAGAAALNIGQNVSPDDTSNGADVGGGLNPSAGTTNAAGGGGGFGGVPNETRGSQVVVSVAQVAPAGTVGGVSATIALTVAGCDMLGLWPQVAPPNGGVGGAGGAGGGANGGDGPDATSPNMGGAGGGGGGASSGGLGGNGGKGGKGGKAYAVLYVTTAT